MKTIKKTTYLILLAFMTVMASCSSDDDSSNPGDPSAQQGEPHTYDITISGGTAGEKHVSGEIKNTYNEESTNLSVYNIEEGIKTKGFYIGNSEIHIIGQFYEVNGQTPDFGLGGDNASELDIFLSPPLEDGYSSVAGTVELSNVNYHEVTSTTGMASYKLTFNGTFETDQGDETVQISGTIVVNMPEFII